MADLPSAVAATFSPSGPLARHLPTYEPRPGQAALAQEIAGAMAAGRPLLAEAGTGTGKSLAYLIPALLSGLRVVVSTGTKNLQEQLLHQDVPLAERALGRRFAVQVLKGRTNYLCELRAERVLAQLALPDNPQAPLLAAVRTWRAATQTGDRAELGALRDEAPLWPRLSATFEQCLGRACLHAERCWMLDARRRAQTAGLVVVNHHLYLADLLIRARQPEAPIPSLIPPHDFVIFDEAHELEDTAAQHLGCEASGAQLRLLRQDLDDELLHNPPTARRLAPSLLALDRAGEAALSALPERRQRARLDPADLSAATLDACRGLEAALMHLEAALAQAEPEALKRLARRLLSFARALAFCLGQPLPVGGSSEAAEPHAENAAGPLVRTVVGTGAHRTLSARPVDVAGQLGPLLQGTPALFISATLQTDGTFAHAHRRLGLAPETATFLAPSPFDYARQATLYLPRDLPEPDQPHHAEAAAQRTAELVAAAQGGALVLCTSHRALGPTAAALRAGAGCHGGPVLVQGEAPKGALLRALRGRTDAALVATLSFWQGVDVPGPALRLVIIDRLPFASPADPWLEAKLDLMRQRGLDPFRAHQIPQAALLLRQGFGRLIRRADDRGVVAILDRRIGTRSYGRTLLRALPACRQVHAWPEIEELLRGQRPQGEDAADSDLGAIRSAPSA